MIFAVALLLAPVHPTPAYSNALPKPIPTVCPRERSVQDPNMRIALRLELGQLPIPTA